MSMPLRMSLFWQYNPVQRMHYLYGEKYFDDSLANVLSDCMGIADGLGGKIRSYILDVLKSDYVEIPVRNSEFVAVRVDFMSDGANVNSRLMSMTHTENTEAIKMRGLMVDYVDLLIRSVFNGEVSSSTQL